MAFIDRVNNFTRCDLSDSRPFRIAGRDLGWVRSDFALRLSAYPDTFTVTAAGVDLADHLRTPEQRTAAVDAVLRELHGEGEIPNWRDEPYPVVEQFADQALMVIERAAASRFGFRAFGVHVNGYVRRGGKIDMWVARRAYDRAVAPGQLDQIIAGGQPAGLTLRENLQKEAAEEANMPASLIDKAVAVGEVSYQFDLHHGMRNDTLFIYDLELPESFIPSNTDGEVEEFILMPLAEVAEIVRESDQFKFNCSLVVIDFLLRHRWIGGDERALLEQAMLQERL